MDSEKLDLLIEIVGAAKDAIANRVDWIGFSIHNVNNAHAVVNAYYSGVNIDEVISMRLIY